MTMYALSFKLHMFYSLHANWNELTFPSIAHHFPVLQRYYRPNAIRQSYKSRLETAGLWSLPGIEIEQEKKAFSRKPQDFDRLSEQQSTEAKEGVKAHDRFLQVFEREKVRIPAFLRLSPYSPNCQGIGQGPKHSRYICPPFKPERFFQWRPVQILFIFV